MQFALNDGTPNGEEHEFRVFAVCEANSKLDKEIRDYYSSGIESDDDYEAYIKNLYRNSLYDTGETEIPEKILALSTCKKPGQGSSERLIVYAGYFSGGD